MSWLKQSASSNSLQDSVTSLAASSSSSNMSRTANQRVTRFLACGTVYITHSLSVPASIVQPSQEQSDSFDSQSKPPTLLQQTTTTTSVRAKQVATQRGGSAVNILSILAQFNVLSLPSRRNTVECALVAPLGSDAAGRALMHELELEGIRTRFCKVHQAGVPMAFVLRSDEHPAKTVINHNPLPELSHEDFISILGPILVPEHYQGLMSHHWHPHPTLPQPPPVHSVYGPGPGVPPVSTLSHPSHPSSATTPSSHSAQQPLPPTTPGLPSIAPFTLFHITGRAPQADGISLLNLTGVDGLARDRFWRDKTTFSLDCTAPVGSEEGRLTREKLFSHVDVILYSKAYALSVNTSTPPHKLTPRSFLLSQVPVVAKHALLLVHWDADGSALLSVPTREYLQSSVWTDVEAAANPAVPADVEQLLQTASNDRPDTQLSLGSADPRYREFGTLTTNPNDTIRSNVNQTRAMPDWNVGAGRNGSNETPRELGGSSMDGDVIDHAETIGHIDAPGVGTFDYGFADAFAAVSPDSSWDYRANRTAVIYDSGDDSESEDNPNARANHGQGLELQTEVYRTGVGPSGVIISEGVALSPSDVDSDVDGNAAAMASRFVMEERMRRVYGPMDGDLAESDQLDYTSIEQPDDGNDSDATEGGMPSGGPTRIGKLKKEKLRQKEQEEVRAREEAERADQQELVEKDDAVSVYSTRSQAPAPKPPPPPVPIGVIEAWQAGILYALTRHVLPGPPYCPANSANRPGLKADSNSKNAKKVDPQDAADWAWRWRLDECLRFAAELSGRRAKKGAMEGLAHDMEQSGWI